MIQFRQVRLVAQGFHLTAIVLLPTPMSKRIKNRSLPLVCNPKGRLLVSLTQQAVSLWVYGKQLHWESSSKYSTTNSFIWLVSLVFYFEYVIASLGCEGHDMIKGFSGRVPYIKQTFLRFFFLWKQKYKGALLSFISLLPLVIGGKKEERMEKEKKQEKTNHLNNGGCLVLRNCNLIKIKTFLIAHVSKIFLQQ